MGTITDAEVAASRDRILAAQALIAEMREYAETVPIDQEPVPAAPAQAPAAAADPDGWYGEFMTTLTEPLGMTGEQLDKLANWKDTPAGTCRNCHRGPVSENSWLCLYCRSLGQEPRVPASAPPTRKTVRKRQLATLGLFVFVVVMMTAAMITLTVLVHAVFGAVHP